MGGDSIKTQAGFDSFWLMKLGFLSLKFFFLKNLINQNITFFYKFFIIQFTITQII